MTEADFQNAKPLKNPLAYFNLVENFFFDVDGVLTDGKIISTEAGELVRTFHSRDGYAIRHAIEHNYNIVVITGGKGNSIESRLRGLGITQFFTNATNKLPIFQRYCAEHNIDPMRSLFMGDDLNDYEVMQYVGLACCPSDAATEIIKISNYVSPVKGGEGCVRDVIEKVMQLNGKWMKNIAATVSG